ncbi:hypothetical protein [Henriciella pelagia]|uniref:hypothetical protein n=1 Tax=Henriciella pelagia TaxID=1977912 RepID=UPI003512C631
MTSKLWAATAIALTTTACSTTGGSYLTNSTEITKTIIDYEISGISYAMAADIIANETRASVTQVSVQRNIEPDVLPTDPGRIELVNPFADTHLSGFASLAGAQAIEVANCPDARLVVTASNDSWARYGETAQYTNCLWHYEGGLHFASYSAFTVQRGMSMGQLVRQAAEPVLGDRERLIVESRQRIISALTAAGATVQETRRRSS